MTYALYTFEYGEAFKVNAMRANWPTGADAGDLSRKVHLLDSFMYYTGILNVNLPETSADNATLSKHLVFIDLPQQPQKNIPTAHVAVDMMGLEKDNAALAKRFHETAVNYDYFNQMVDDITENTLNNVPAFIHPKCRA